MIAKSKCSGCGESLPAPFLNLGEYPLANSCLDPSAAADEEFQAPLAVSFCPACYLVQLTHIVPPQQLFFSYLYFSSFSESYLRHAERMADDLCDRFRLGAMST